MNVYDAILSRRSIRRFKQKPISIGLLKKFINAARLAPSAANLQPLEFVIVYEKGLCGKIFDTLSWAGYIKPKWTPSENERPVAYVIMLIMDKENRWYKRDVSLASENIVLAAEEEGIGSCILAKIDREKIRKILEVPDHVIIDSVIALGYKAEKSVVEDFNGSVEYWRDKDEVLHVPKKRLDDIFHDNKF